MYGKYRTKRAYKKAVGKSHRGALRAVGSAIKNRYGNKGGFTQLAKDVSMLKGMLNTEKKRVEANSYGNKLGQCDVNNDGFYSYEITPLPSQGTGYGNREGSSILFKSFHSNIQFVGQSAQIQKMRIKMMVVQTQDALTTPLGDWLTYNKFIYAVDGATIFDFQSQINPDYRSKIKIIKQKYITLQADTASSQLNMVTTQLKLKFKKGHHIRFNGNTNTPTNNRFFVILLAESGNRSTTTSSTLSNVCQQAPNTGCVVSWNSTAYYIDN